MHASESQHWYARDGSPQYEVPAVKGGMRPATLRDARKIGLVPSVTTIIRMAAAPGLERWKQEQVLHAALTLPKIEGETETAYLARIWQDSREQGRKAAERGTAIHAAIQGHYEGEAPHEEYWPHVKGCAEALKEHFGVDSWIAEKSFSHRMGFGGKTDLHATNEVVDVKTKEFGPDDKIIGYDEHKMQLAAYRFGLGMPEARCGNAFVSVNNPGLVRIVEYSQAELVDAWIMFASLLTFWQHKTGHYSGWDSRDAA